MRESEPNNIRTVDSVTTACNILDTLQELGGAGVTELANNLGTAKGTMHAHLATLEQAEYVSRKGDKYVLSLKFLNMGESVKQRVSIYEGAKKHLDDLVKDANGPGALFVEEHGIGICVYMAKQSQGITPPVRVGNRSYLHCIASGKAILAHLPKDEVQEIIERRGLPPITENTITDPDELWNELERIRDCEVAFNDEESLKGLRGIGAPILDPSGHPRGAIGISGTVGQFNDDRLYNELANLIQNTANFIEINTQFKEQEPMDNPP